jgi:hypothetical protein
MGLVQPERAAGAIRMTDKEQTIGVQTIMKSLTRPFPIPSYPGSKKIGAKHEIAWRARRRELTPGGSRMILEAPSIRPICFAMYGQIPDDPDWA